MNDVNFTIVDYSIEGNSILVRPYSPDFKNPPETYSVGNINITNLNDNEDILIQIAKYMRPVVQSILNSETDITTVVPLVTSLELNKTYNIPLSVLNIASFTPSTTNIPLSSVSDHSEYVIENKLQETYSAMLSATLLGDIDFLN